MRERVERTNGPDEPEVKYSAVTFVASESCQLSLHPLLAGAQANLERHDPPCVRPQLVSQLVGYWPVICQRSERRWRLGGRTVLRGLLDLTQDAGAVDQDVELGITRLLVLLHVTKDERRIQHE